MSPPASWTLYWDASLGTPAFPSILLCSLHTQVHYVLVHRKPYLTFNSRPKCFQPTPGLSFPIVPSVTGGSTFPGEHARILGTFLTLTLFHHPYTVYLEISLKLYL